MWFCGFLSGYLLAQLGWGFVIPHTLLLTGVCIGVLWWGRKKPLVWLCTGFVWGLGHNAPFPERGGVVMTVERHNPLQFFHADVLAVNERGDYRRVRGYGNLQGRVDEVDAETAGNYMVFPSAPRLVPLEREERAPSNDWLVRLRRSLLHNADKISEPVRSWVLSITLGGGGKLPSSLQDAFKFLGLFHILVISGLHVTILAHCWQKFLRLLLKFFYSVRLVSPVAQFRLAPMVDIFSCAVVIFYGCIVGFSPPAQRAVLLFVLPYLWRKCKKGGRQKLVLFLQTLLFPIGFCSDSLLLSWAAYLIVLDCFRRIRQANAVSAKLRHLLQGQIIITATIVCFFGEISLLTIPLNIFLLPIVPLIIVSGGMLLFISPESFLAILIKNAHFNFLLGIASIADFSSNYKWLTINLHSAPLLRAGIFFILVIILLNKSAFLPKGDSGAELGGKFGLDRKEGSHR